MSLGLLSPRVDAPINWVDPVNWLHPLNAGLLTWLLCLRGSMGGSRWSDLCRRGDGILTTMNPVTDWTTQSFRQGGWGGITFPGSDDKVVIPTVTFPSGAPWTLTTWLKPSDTSTRVFASGGTQTRILNVNPGTSIQVRGEDNAAENFTVTLGTTGRHIALTHTGALMTLYVDGVLISTNASATDFVWTTIGGYNNFVNFQINGPMDDVRFYNRCLSAFEVADYYQLSRQYYPGLLNRLLLGPSIQVPVNHYTLSCDSGLYAIDGTEMIPKAGRKLTADSGAYALAGQDASPKAQRKITAESGAYSIQGVAAELKCGKKLTADPGVYSITGQAASLLRKYFLSAGVGSYVITGTAATLTKEQAATPTQLRYLLAPETMTYELHHESLTYQLPADPNDAIGIEE